MNISLSIAYLKDSWKSTNYGVTWTVATSTASSPFSGRSSLSAVAFGTTVYSWTVSIFGGNDAATACLSDVWQSGEDDASLWSKITTNVSICRTESAALVSLNGLLVTMLGGFSTSGIYNNDVWMSYFIPCQGTAYTLSSNGLCQCADGYSGNPANKNGVLDEETRQD